jgi:ABC-type glycerol-3-phosphate transport system substrate-binding protein
MKLLKSLMLVVAAGLMLTACGGGSSASPSEVAKKFVEATVNLDFEEVKKYIAKEHFESIDKATKQLESPEAKAYLETYKALAKDVKVEVVSEEISEDGNSATVTLSYAIMGQTQEQKLPLIKEDGAWKINEAASSGK